MPQAIKVGDTVRLSAEKARRRSETKDVLKIRAKVRTIYKDIDGGVSLDQPLAGFFSWNVQDLIKIPRKTP